jgi:hypothetical protein
LGAYFLPLSTVFAGHNANNGNANQAARDKISKGQSSNPTTDSKTKSNSGSLSNPITSTGSSSPSKGKDTTFSNGNSAQIGGPNDKGNVGRANTGTDNTGIGNNGNGNTGHGNHGNGNCGHNLNGNGNVGNAGNGIGGGKYGGPRGCGHGAGP